MENKIRFEEIKKLENNITSLLDGILKYIQPYEDLRLEMKALTADSHPVFGAFDYEHMYTVFKDYLQKHENDGTFYFLYKDEGEGKGRKVYFSFYDMKKCYETMHFFLFYIVRTDYKKKVKEQEDRMTGLLSMVKDLF